MTEFVRDQPAQLDYFHRGIPAEEQRAIAVAGGRLGILYRRGERRRDMRPVEQQVGHPTAAANEGSREVDGAVVRDECSAHGRTARVGRGIVSPVHADLFVVAPAGRSCIPNRLPAGNGPRDVVQFSRVAG